MSFRKLNIAVLATAITSTLAVPVERSTQAATSLCGNEDYLVLDSTPWIVYNMMYNADE